MLESVSVLLANKTANASKNNVAILTYGYELVLSTFLTAVLIVATSALTGEIITGWIFIVFYVPVRVCAGGYHAKTFIGCNFVSIASFITVMQLIKVGDIYFNTFAWHGILIVSIIIILTFAPHENKNQPMTLERRQKNKKNLKVRLLIETVIIIPLLRMGIMQVHVAILSLGLVATLLIIAKLMKGENHENAVETD